MRPASLLLLSFSFVAACRDRDPRWSETATVDGPFAAGGALLWVNRGTSRLVAVDPSSAEVRSTALIEHVRAVGYSAGEVLVIGGTGQSPSLVAVAPDGSGRREVPLPAAYDRLEVAPDGRHALALYDPRATPAGGAPAARNANEVAVIDLVAGTARREVLETESLAPRAVVFAPAGDLAAVLLDSAVALVDAGGARPALRIPLELAGGARLTPERAIFSPDGRYLYVQTAGGSDVLALEIEREPARFGASINFLSAPGGERVKDIAVAGTAPALASSVAVVFQSGNGAVVALLDATGDVSKTHAASIQAPLTRLETIGEGMLVVHGSPDRRGAQGSAYLAAWEPLADRVDLTQLSGPTFGPAHAGGGVAFFEHVAAGGSGTPAVTAVKVDAQGAELRARSSPVLIGGRLTGLAGDGARGEIYLGVEVQRMDSGAAPLDASDDDFSGSTGSLVVVKAAGLEISAVPLDQVITGVGVIGDVVYALHPASGGDVTFLPRADLRRERARRSDGFLLAGLLEVSP